MEGKSFFSEGGSRRSVGGGGESPHKNELAGQNGNGNGNWIDERALLNSSTNSSSSGKRKVLTQSQISFKNNEDHGLVEGMLNDLSIGGEGVEEGEYGYEETKEGIQGQLLSHQHLPQLNHQSQQGPEYEYEYHQDDLLEEDEEDDGFNDGQNLAGEYGDTASILTIPIINNITQDGSKLTPGSKNSLGRSSLSSSSQITSNTNSNSSTGVGNSIGPRMTKSAALRAGVPWEDLSAAAARRKEKRSSVVDFGNTPGHKRLSVDVNVASLSAPTFTPKQTKASLLRAGGGGGGSTNGTPKTPNVAFGSGRSNTPTLRSSSSSPAVPHNSNNNSKPLTPTKSQFDDLYGSTPGHKRSSLSLASGLKSLEGPKVPVRGTRASLLRTGSGGGVGGSVSPSGMTRTSSPMGYSSLDRGMTSTPTSTRLASVAELGTGRMVITPKDENNSPSPEKKESTTGSGSVGRKNWDVGKGGRRRDSVVVTPKSLEGPAITPRSNRASMLRNPVDPSILPPLPSPSVPRSMTPNEHRERNKEIFDGIPGHKRRQSLMVGSTASPVVTPRLNRAATLRQDPTMAQPSPSALHSGLVFKARPLPSTYTQLTGGSTINEDRVKQTKASLLRAGGGGKARVNMDELETF